MSHFYRPRPSSSRHPLVYLHGHGSSPELVHPWFRQHHDDGWLRVCPAAQVPVDDGASWYGSGPRGVDRAQLDESVARVCATTEAAMDEVGATWSDVVVGGFSQGASVALAVAIHLGRERAPGGLLLQAGFLPELWDDELDLSLVGAAEVLIQHGRDDEVVPPFLAEDLAGPLRAAGSVVTVELLPGGHTLSPAMLDGARAWLAPDDEAAS